MINSKRVKSNMSLKLKLQRHFRFYTEIYSGNWDIEENPLQLASVPFVRRELFLIRRRSSIFRFWTLPKGALWPWHRIKLGRTKRQITFDSFYVVVSFLSSTSGSCFTWLKMQNWWKPFRQKQKNWPQKYLDGCRHLWLHFLRSNLWSCVGDDGVVWGWI